MKKALLLTFVLMFTLSLNAQWVEQTTGVTTSIATISAVDANVVWAAGDGGVVLRTTNGGTSWTSVGTGTDDFYNICGIDANNALVTCSPASGGILYRTTNGGTSWTTVLTQTGGFFDAILMFNATQGILIGDPVGARWTIFKTNNGGATWDSAGLYLPQVGTEAGWNNSLYQFNGDLYFGTNSNKIYKSTNLGSSWTAIPVGITNSFGIWFNSPTRALVGGSTQGMYGTTNGGTSWAAVTVPGTGTIYSVVGGGAKWLYIRGTQIVKSINDGAAWTTDYTATAGNFLTLVTPRNSVDVVWATRDNGGIVKNTTVGLPVELSSFSGIALEGAIKLDWSTASEKNNRGFEIERKCATGEFTTVGFVTGRGTTTESVNYTFTDNNVDAGTYTYRLKQNDYDGSYAYSKEIEVSVIAPSVFVLSQNYPNPFNPSTVINYSIPASGLVKLSVYNLLGQEVKTLVNEFQETGAYSVTFSASNLPSGTYFYRLESGSFSVTNKMQLTK